LSTHPSRIINLGVVAHVDAGKTSLTERLLFTAGVIDRLGSVDSGDTQTDTSSIERRRGITIRTAVASFKVNSAGQEPTQVNLIDTPGHAEFVAEVERALSVLDGAILMVSASHGIQPRTRILMRTLRRLRLPTLIMINKIDLPGVDPVRITEQVRTELADRAVVITQVDGCPRPVGSYDAELAEVLTLTDDDLLAEWVAGTANSDSLSTAFVQQVHAGQVHPVLHGSAVTGAGIDSLNRAVCDLLPPANRSAPTEVVTGEVFSVGRDAHGHRQAHIRIRSGEVRRRGRITVGGRRITLTSVRTFVGTRLPALQAAGPGDIAVVQSKPALRVGDRFGSAAGILQRQFPAPALEAVVRPVDPGRRPELGAALQTLADEDPLIRVRILDGDLAVSLYGDIQRQVLTDRLADEFGVPASFDAPGVVYLERPVGRGEAVEQMGGDHRLVATIGLSVEPGRPGSGVRYVRPSQFNGVLPRAFHQAIADTVPRALTYGLRNWPVIDCLVTLTAADYSSVASGGGDFRLLTPLVLAGALRAAGTAGFEPLLRYELDLPAGQVGRAMVALLERGATVETPRVDGAWATMVGALPASAAYALQRDLDGLTGGEGVLSTRPAGVRRVREQLPEGRRSGPDPRDRSGYLRSLAFGQLS